MIIRKEFSFESGHFLYNHPAKCRNMHGHSYRLYVSVEGPVDPVTGMVMDFGDLVKLVQGAVVEKLDHKFLNDIIPLSTSENIAIWIWQQLKPILPGLCQLEIFETTGSCVIYRGE